MNLKTKLEEMRKRCEAARSMDFCPNPSRKVMAVWESHTDMPALIDALEVCLGALEREIFRQEKDDGGAFNHLTNAIAKAEEILGKV